MRPDEKIDLYTAATEIIITQLARLQKKSNYHKLTPAENKSVLDLIRAGMTLEGKLKPDDDKEPKISRDILEEALQIIDNKNKDPK